MTKDSQHSFRFLKLDHLPYFLAYAFLGLFILLPFYDSNNIPLNFASVEAMLNSTPPLDVIRWAGGPFTMSIFVPAYLIYVFSGYNIYYSLLFYKLLFLFLTTLLALLVSRMTEDVGKRKFIFLFILLNPVLIVVNYIWVEIDIFPVFFFTLFYFLLRYKANIQTIDTIVLAFSFAIAVLFYWYPLLFLPTLILYSKRGQNMRPLIYTIFTTSIGIILTLSFISVNLVSATLSLAGASSITRTQISGIQHFITIGNYDYIILMGILLVVLPFLLKKIGFSEPFVLLVLIIIVLVSSNFTFPDNDIFIMPMCFLSILQNRKLQASIKRLLLAEIFPITALFFLSFYIGNTLPDGIGLFYWGYDIFHLNIHFLYTQSQVSNFLNVFNISLVVSVIITIIYLGIVDKKSKLIKGLERGVEIVHKERDRLPLQSKSCSIKLKKIAILTVVVILVLMPVSFVFNANEPVVVSIDSRSNFPTYYLNPSLCPNNGNIVRPIENKTFTTEKNSIDIYSNSPSMSLGRNFTGMAFNFTGTFDFNSNAANLSAYLISSSQFNLTLEHALLPDFNFPNSIAVNYAKYSAATVLSTSEMMPSFVKIQRNEQIEYNINDSGSSGFYYFLFNDINQGIKVSNIFHVQNNHSSISLDSKNGSLILTYADFNIQSVLKTVYINGLNFSNNWNYVLLHPSLNTTYVSVDGQLFNLGVDPFTNTTLFDFGPRYSCQQFTPGLSDMVTHLYYSNTTPVFSPMNIINIVSTAGKYSLFTKTNNFTITVNSSQGGTHVQLFNQSLYMPSSITNFLFGKLSSGQYSIQITLNHFEVTLLKSGYYLIAIFWVIVLPFIVIAWFLLATNTGIKGEYIYPKAEA